MKKIFITGASGFIGGAIAKALVGEHWVLALARSAASIAKVEEIGARAVMGSLETLTMEPLKECDIVIHCAAYVEPWGAYDDFYKVNVEGTKRLIELARKAGVRKFIHVSSEAVLFKGQDLYEIDEQYPYPARSPYHYCETKKLAERLVLEANTPGELETIVLRPRMVWGPGDETLLPNLVAMVDSGRFRWIDKGDYLTSTTHIHNFVAGLKLAMEHGKAGEVYFITDREVHTIRDFFTQWLATAGRTPKDSSVPSWFLRFAAWGVELVWRLFRIRRKPPIARFSAAIMSANCTIASQKAELELGYQPVVTVEEGMAALTKPRRN